MFHNKLIEIDFYGKINYTDKFEYPESNPEKSFQL